MPYIGGLHCYFEEKVFFLKKKLTKKKMKFRCFKTFSCGLWPLCCYQNKKYLQFKVQT